MSEHTSLEALHSKSIIKVQLKTSIHCVSVSSLGLWGQFKAYRSDFNNLKSPANLFAFGLWKEAHRDPHRHEDQTKDLFCMEATVSTTAPPCHHQERKLFFVF